MTWGARSYGTGTWGGAGEELTPPPLPPTPTPLPPAPPSGGGGAIAAFVGGTLTRVAAGGSPALGTLSVIGYATNPALGTLSIDRTLFLAFYSRVRLSRPDVYVGGGLMANLVDTVELDSSLDDPIDYATFTLSDKRSAFFDPATLSNGERSVAIDLWAGPPGSVLKWQNAFTGNTETSANTMPYRPRGVFKAVSLTAKWANTFGCLHVPAMSGLTRGAVIAAFAETAGVAISNAGELGGAIVRKPIDESGKTPYQLIQEYGEIEGWFARATDDGAGLEVISEDNILQGAPVFYFDESNSFDIPETTPNRPVNDWVLSGSKIIFGTSDVPGITESTITEQPGTDANGDPTNTVIEIWTESGVEVHRWTDQYATVVVPGITLSAKSYQKIATTEVVSTWAPFTFIDASGAPVTMPSTMLQSRKTTTLLLMGIPAAVGSIYAHTWVQGGSYLDATAKLQVAEILDEGYTWNADCGQTSALIIRSQLYSPLYISGNAYSDGTLRAGLYFKLQEVSRENIYWIDGRGAFPPYIARHALSEQWYQQATGTEIYGDYSQTVDTWAGNGSNSAYVQSTVTTTAQGTIASSSPILPTLGAVPALPSGSASVAQFSQQPILIEYDAVDASGYTKITNSAMVACAENIDELNKVARRRIRRACSNQIDVPHRCIPFLRPGDHVSVTNHARGLVNVSGYVSNIKRTAAVTNAAMRQVTTVKIPPSWI